MGVEVRVKSCLENRAPVLGHRANGCWDERCPLAGSREHALRARALQTSRADRVIKHPLGYLLLLRQSQLTLGAKHTYFGGIPSFAFADITPVPVEDGAVLPAGIASPTRHTHLPTDRTGVNFIPVLKMCCCFDNVMTVGSRQVFFLYKNQVGNVIGVGVFSIFFLFLNWVCELCGCKMK